MNNLHPDWPFPQDMLLHQSPDEDEDDEDEEDDDSIEEDNDQTDDGYSE